MRGVGILTVVAVLMAAAPARASLTSSEAEQVRRSVATGTEVSRVRALVARPDLTIDEAAAALTSGLATTVIDPAHAAYLRELVFAVPSTAARPALATATLRGLLARADVVLQQHALDLDRAPAALGELARIYAFLEEIATAAPDTNVTAGARADCVRSLADHIARNAALLSPQSPVALVVARPRAQAALAVLDFMPDAPTRRIDAADALTLSGARRALLVERGLLVLDAGAPDGSIATLRSLSDRLPGARAGAEAIWIGGDPAPAELRARDGAILPIAADPGGAAGVTLLWGGDVQSPPGEGWTTAVARGLAKAAVARGIEKNADLRAQVDRDGGVEGVAAMAAMLAIDGPLGVDVAASRLLGGHRESAACLADAIGALAVFAPPPARPADGVSVAVGARAAGPAPVSVTRVTLSPSASAATFRLEGHTWLFERDASGAVTAMRRDGQRVTAAMVSASPRAPTAPRP